MPLDSLALDLARQHRTRDAQDAIALAQSDPRISRIALVSSFGAESAVLLHLVSRVAPDMDVLFLDTGKHFPETLAYKDQVARQLGLTNVQIVSPSPQGLAQNDPYGALHTFDADRCCAVRKVTPLRKALDGFDGWITGRKRYQGGIRKTLAIYEGDEATGKLKINPLAFWTPQDMAEYIRAHELPPHPLVAQGFRSIGCAPCTAKTGDAANARAGRWAGKDKSECGIHLPAQGDKA